MLAQLKIYIQILVLHLFLLKTVATCPGLIKHANMVGEKCRKEIGLSPHIITQVNKYKELPDDETLKWYLRCLMINFGVSNEQGNIRPEIIISIAPQDIRERVASTVRKCGSKIGRNGCDSVWLTHKCYVKEDPEFYILV